MSDETAGVFRGLSPFGFSLIYFATTIPGGFHVPSPGGTIEGGSVFGQ